MPSVQRIKQDIAEVGQRPKAVCFDEITRILDRLKAVGFSAKYRKGKETWVFYIEGQKFTVCEHNTGSSHVKVCYVKNFLTAMANLGLHED